LHALPVAVLAMPANGSAQANLAKTAKLIVDYFSHVFFLTCTHFALRQKQEVVKRRLFEELVWLIILYAYCV